MCSLSSPGFKLAKRALLLAAILVALAAPLTGQTQGSQEIYALTLEGIINPPAAGYIERGVGIAVSRRAEAIVLLLDTPGGLDESMRKIVQAIDNSAVPVITYVSPQGARAASAGTFIALASHLAVMAPGTTIGSATPIALGQSGETQEMPEDLRNKVVNEAVSYIRDHAERHGRNADWAEKAVREGANLSSAQAVEQSVVELVAEDLNDLLGKADGMEVRMAGGEVRPLRLAGAALTYEDMTIVERFLHAISNPNIAFILLSLAMLGLFFELSTPGAIFPGVAGGVFLLLALYALGTLNAFWGGILLVVLAFGLLVAELFTPTNGILGVGGVIALITGALVLFADAPSGVYISPWVIGATAILAVAFFLFFVRAIILSYRPQAGLIGSSSLVGLVGMARTDLTPEGTVFIHGERWRAQSSGGEQIDAGQEIIVERTEGMKLWVTPARKEGEA